LHLPKPVEDLRAVRRGNNVRLTWTMPGETTDGEGIRGEVRARVCRGFRTQADEACNQVAKDIPFSAQVASEGSKQSFTDDLSPLLRDPAGREYVTYSIEVLNARNRSAGPSNAQTVFLAPAMPPPGNLSASVAPDAIVLDWTAATVPVSTSLHTEYIYRVLRAAPEATTATVVSEFPAAQQQSLRDTNFEWQKTYTYQLQGVTRVRTGAGELLSEFVGDPSTPVTVIANDIFPPSAPSGIEAVYAGELDPAQNFVDLTWTPNTEPDLAGYNVYREDGGTPAVRLNTSPVVTPSFRDARIRPGSYTYAVTAVDARGNESRHSQPASEAVPAR